MRHYPKCRTREDGSESECKRGGWWVGQPATRSPEAEAVVVRVFRKPSMASGLRKRRVWRWWQVEGRQVRR